jgi:predicted RNA-binding protein with PIN domain
VGDAEHSRAGTRRPVALVDARNVLRSTWPNIPEPELVRLCRRWASEQGCRAVVVFDGAAPADESDADTEVVSTGRQSADDWIAREAAAFRARHKPFWLVTSDRGLRARVPGAEQTIGGGMLARTLLALDEPRSPD